MLTLTAQKDIIVNCQNTVYRISLLDPSKMTKQDDKRLLSMCGEEMITQDTTSQALHLNKQDPLPLTFRVSLCTLLQPQNTICFTQDGSKELHILRFEERPV